MKKIALLSAGLLIAGIAEAQLTLSGTSYTQDFDNIGGGLPTGWSLYTSAESTTLGTDVSTTKYVATNTRWNWTTGNFRNVASADGFTMYYLADTAAQHASNDRALAVRQVGNTSSTFPGTDSGAAFVLNIANTNGLTNFQMSVKLQSLDSTSPRVTTWTVDYGFGANPTAFTAATITGTNTTGGNTYSNNTITVNFGSALDNQSGPIWIRIVTLNWTTGSGNRTTTGIDDFQLNWTSSTPSGSLSIASTSPTDNATSVAPNSNLMLTFDKAVQKGTGNIKIKNVTDQLTTTIPVSSADVTVSGKMVTIANVGLLPSKSYYVLVDSTTFDTAGIRSSGIYDTTAWSFSTGPNSIVTIEGKKNIPVTVIGQPTNSNINISFTSNGTSLSSVAVFDLAGRELYRQEVKPVKGLNNVVLTPASLAGGLYIIKVSDKEQFGTVKAYIQ